MSTAAIEQGEVLLAKISSKDAQQALKEVQQFREKMTDMAAGADFVIWITEPANLTRVHRALAEDLGVPPKLLAIRRMAMSRTKRAMLLTQAIELAIKKVHSL